MDLQETSNEFMSDNDAVEKALSIVDELSDEDLSPAVETDPKPSSEAEPTGDTIPSEEDGQSEHEEEEAPETVSLAPKSWKADAKELFAKLPPDLQKQVLERDTEQQTTFNRIVNEAAVKRREADTEREQAAAERQRYAAQLQQLSQITQFYDPVIADARQTDWDKLNRENPAEYVAKKHNLEKHVQMLQAVAAEKQQIDQSSYNERRGREIQNLIAKLPEWSDESKRSQISQKMQSALSEHYGFKPEELNNINDHRVMLAMLDLAKYREMLQGQKTVEQKRTTPTPRTMRPQAARDSGGEVNQRAQALKQRAIRTGKEDDAVAAVLAAIGDLK